jgi:hypothetical protein
MAFAARALEVSTVVSRLLPAAAESVREPGRNAAARVGLAAGILAAVLGLAVGCGRSKERPAGPTSSGKQGKPGAAAAAVASTKTNNPAVLKELEKQMDTNVGDLDLGSR